MKQSLAALALLSCTAWPAVAGLVYDTSALGELSGTRSSPAANGIVIGGGDAIGATLSWNIAFNSGTGLYSYSYQFGVTYPAGFTGQQGISHFILDLSDTCISAGTLVAGCVTNTYSANGLEVVIGTYTTNGNPGFPGSITGIKWNVVQGGTQFSISFDSEREPVYGDFYAKGGNGSSNGFSLWNTGALLHESSENVNDFVARPDTVVACRDGECGSVPLPGSVALIGAGLIGLSTARRRRSPSPT